MQAYLVPLDVATKLAVSLGVGLFAGFEREWWCKEVGGRAFALTALLGTLSALISIPFSIAALAAVGLIIASTAGHCCCGRRWKSPHRFR